MENAFGLILTFFKVGALTVGGAAAILPVLFHELVAGNWLTEGEFLYGVALGETTPGPAVLGMAVAGIKWGGLLGGFSVIVALVLPGILWMGAAAFFFKKFRDRPWVRWFLSGLKPAVPGLLAALAAEIVFSAANGAFLVPFIAVLLWLIFRWRVAPALLVLGAVFLAWVKI